MKKIDADAIKRALGLMDEEQLLSMYGVVRLAGKSGVDATTLAEWIHDALENIRLREWDELRKMGLA